MKVQLAYRAAPTQRESVRGGVPSLRNPMLLRGVGTYVPKPAVPDGRLNGSHDARTVTTVPLTKQAIWWPSDTAMEAKTSGEVNKLR